MKKTLFIFVMILSAGLILSSCNQGKKTENKGEKSEVPEAVQKAFTAKFADAKDVKWESEEEGEYEAEFTLNGKKMSADFAADGTWKETESKVNYSSLPSSVLDTLSARFKDYKVENMTVEKTETPDGTFWEVELKKDENETEVLFKEDGTVVKQKIEEEEEEVKEATGEEHEKGEKKEEGEEEEHEGGEK